MKKLLAVTLAAAMLPIFVQAALAQNLEEIFRKASPTVVVVRSKGRDVGGGGVTRFKTVAQDSMAWKMGLQGGNKVVTIVDGEVFDHGVGVRELVAGREPRPCRETSHEFDFFGASCATEICGRTDGVANAGNKSDPIFLERMHLRELRNRIGEVRFAVISASGRSCHGDGAVGWRAGGRLCNGFRPTPSVVWRRTG